MNCSGKVAIDGKLRSLKQMLWVIPVIRPAKEICVAPEPFVRACAGMESPSHETTERERSVVHHLRKRLSD